MTSRTALDNSDFYTIAWIAALPIERAAAEIMLDETHAPPTNFTKHQTDQNIYTWGRLGEHNVVIASLEAGSYGTSMAAMTASSLLASLPSIRIGLLVGIGGGIARPTDNNQDIRLGDIVVSQPGGTMGGVCQHDLIKAKTGGKRERTGLLGKPPTVLLHALSKIQAVHERDDSKVSYHLQNMLEKYPKMGKKTNRNPGYAHQGSENDRLFQASCAHTSGSDCRDCDKAGEVLRDARDTTDPEIYYGIIASGNTLIKDAAERDRIVNEVGENCLCFEMEAAGLMNSFPCLVIRGICDYVDAHKNDQWQRYASATAAAYAKELLAYVPAVEVQETKRALEVMQSVDQKLDLVGHTINATKTTVDHIKSSTHTDKIERWLHPPDASTNANHARTLRHEGTGMWLLAHPAFQSWSSGSCRHLWLHGLAGCGKTVLSTTVLDHVTAANDRLLISFFFDFSDTTKQTVDGMLRSLAFQLYQSETGSSVLDASFQAHRRGHQQPATKTLKDVVNNMLRVQKKVSVVLDALDESTTRSDLLLWIKNIASGSDLGHVQLICTSRPEAEFLKEVPEAIGRNNDLRLNKHTQNDDIGFYVSAALSLRREFIDMRLSHDLLSRIQSKVGGGADGMFRWAACQLDSLARCPSPKELKDALGHLPQDLNETYECMLHGIPKEGKNSAIRLLQFLVHSSRPLTVPEAVDIIATDTEATSPCFTIEGRVFRDNHLLQSLPGLTSIVEVTEYNGNIRRELHLAHFSVKEFLLNQGEFHRLRASVIITRTCLTYLTDITGSHEEIKQKFHFARLAARMWTEHGASAESSEDILRAISRFLNDEETFDRWLHLYGGTQGQPNDRQLLRRPRFYYACLYGLLRVAQELAYKGTDINAQGGDYDEALQAASASGHIEVIRLLLEKGADVDARGSDNDSNALQLASINGHIEVIRLLLEKGADINARGGDYNDALQAASASGHIEVIRLLLEKGADINAIDSKEGNPLQLASAIGHIEVIQLLLEKGADIHAWSGGKGYNALQIASANGNIEVIQLLLEKGADINSWSSDNDCNALQIASMSGYIEITRLLLEKGADINAHSSYHGEALQAASYRGCIEVIRLLLEKGADVNAQGGYYGNALQTASTKGYIEVIRLLLEKGADVNAQGGYHGNALQAASSGGYIEVIRLLLEKGADTNAQGGHYGNALNAASVRGHYDAERVLQQRIAHPSSRKRVASTPPAEIPNKRLRRKSFTHSTS
ncbi:hypothetical protein BN1723_010350 [Verticillium longisporum]|uniref:Uncharacterized protein n=1 Tax=Verticillium longisporum TaxID=100787 RepID=A0A0G4KLX8_VERLO|nr:hypothetical protein BN1708_009908 [Verticillium longisporum]CRK14464.1 hypothetical protein BN1723_010350 [Verticillium longisporum]